MGNVNKRSDEKDPASYCQYRIQQVATFPQGLERECLLLGWRPCSTEGLEGLTHASSLEGWKVGHIYCLKDGALLVYAPSLAANL
jgi:hypothetical protein